MENIEIIASLERLCLKDIEPHMEHDDAEGKFRWEIYHLLGQNGFTGVTIHEDFGGAGMPYQSFAEILCKLAEYSVSYAVTVSVSTMVQSMIQEFGTPKQKSTFLPPLTSGEEIGSFALSESHAGSDAAALKTSAKKVEGGWMLNGSKMWITSGGLSKTYIVMARTGAEGAKGVSSFLVRSDAKGFSVSKKEKKMGWNISPTCELTFENCFVPDDQMLGQEGQGFAIAMKALDRGRITIGAIGVGVARRCLRDAAKYALEREQFKQKIFDFQGLQFMLADMATETEAAWLLVNEAARLLDLGTPNQKLGCMAKLKATDVAMSVSTDAIQILGGVGYTKEYPLERFMRDAKVLQIVEGTNQIQKVVIARQLRKENE